jgi:hypothetical protein
MVVDAHRDTLMPDDYGPQRWNVYGDKLEETTEAGLWVDKDKNLYDNDEVYPYNPVEEAVGGKPMRRELTYEEQSWMAAHECYLEPDGYWESMASEHECVEYKEEIGEDGEGMGLSDIEFSKEATEISLEEMRFWRRMVWIIGHNPKGGVAYGRKFSNAKWFTGEKKKYVWELIKDEEPGTYRYAKYLMMKSRAILRRIGDNSPSAPLTPDHAKRVVKKDTRKDGTNKVLKIHMYKSIRACREGFVLYWTTDGKVKLTQKTFLDNRIPKQFLKALVSRAKELGYTIQYVDVVDNCLRLFKKTPRYSKVRSMSEKEYTSSGLAAMI